MLKGTRAPFIGEIWLEQQNKKQKHKNLRNLRKTMTTQAAKAPIFRYNKSLPGTVHESDEIDECWCESGRINLINPTEVYIYHAIPGVDDHMCHGQKSLYWGWSSHL